MRSEMNRSLSIGLRFQLEGEMNRTLSVYLSDVDSNMRVKRNVGCPSVYPNDNMRDETKRRLCVCLSCVDCNMKVAMKFVRLASTHNEG